MKRAKRLTALLAALLMVTILATAAYAAEDGTTYNVWLETKASASGDNNALEVCVRSDGSATDGLLQVSYDPSVVSATADSVTAMDGVDLFSANVEEEGTLLISWLAKKDADADQLFAIRFDVARDADPGLDMTGTASDVNGQLLRVGVKAAPEATTAPSTATPGATTPSTATPGAAGTAAPGTGAPSTGDDASPTFWAAVTAACALTALAAGSYIRRLRRTDR